MVVLTGDLELAMPGWEELQAGLSSLSTRKQGLEWEGLSHCSLSWGGSLGHCGWKEQDTHVDLPLSPTISSFRCCCFLRAKHLWGEPLGEEPQGVPHWLCGTAEFLAKDVGSWGSNVDSLSVQLQLFTDGKLRPRGKHSASLTLCPTR